MGYGELLHKSEQRTISPAICVYIDANGLHELNNERGHEAGDLMLRFVADSLMEQFPRGSLYRVGGDEFVVFPAPVEGQTYLYPVYVLTGHGTMPDGTTEWFEVIVDAQA